MDETELLINYLEDQEMLDQYLLSNQNFAEYVLSNLGEVGWLATPEALSIFAGSLGTKMDNLAQYLDDGSKVLKEASETLMKKAGAVLVAGKAMNPAFAAIGFHYGVESDMAEGKTRGEAVAHNGGALLVGIGVTAGLGLALTPVGWAAVGVAAAGVGATMFFEFLYNKNVFGLQDGLDWVGNKLDDAEDWVGDKLDSAGEALSNTLDFINPFS